MSHRKRVRTLGSFFTPNQSQSESEKNDTEEEQCINQEETDEDRRKPKKSRDHTWLRYEKESMLCYFCWKSKKTNPFASAEGCTNFCPPKNENVPQNFSQGDKLSPSDQILAQTLIIISNNLLLFNFIQGLLHVYLVNMYQVLFGICLTIIK